MESTTKTNKSIFRQGFTLMEMLLAVATLGIILTMAFPDFIGFLKMADAQTEQKQMQSIQKALKLYAEDKKRLPSGNTWVSAVEEYSDLSTAQINTNVYGSLRNYKRISATKQFRDITITIFYAAVSSNGEDKADDTNIDSMASVADYNALVPINDDHLIKFTNLKNQIKNYEITQQRIKNIKKALEAYSLRLFNIASATNGEVVAAYIAANGEVPTEDEASAYALTNSMDYYPYADKRIYYPRSGNFGESSGSDLVGFPSKYSWLKISNNSRWNYAEMQKDLQTFIDRPNDVPGTRVRTVINRGSVNLASHRMRIFSMKGFMRLLGLPEENCCDATVYVGDLDSDGESDEMPLYYCSNPKVNGVYPGFDDRKLPATVTTTPRPCD